MNRNIFQILISEAERDAMLPETVRISAASLRELHPTFDYQRLDLDDLEAFIGSEFDSDTLACLRALKPHSYKANLGRYCLLLARGGIYADVVIRLLRPLELPEAKEMICFRDTPGSGLWTVSTSLIAAKAGREEFKVAIDLIKANVANRYYGDSPLQVSGPGVFGRALAIVNRSQEIDIGSFEYLGHDRNPHNIGHVDSSGRIVSLRWKTGSFCELGLNGTNDYASMWHARCAYGEIERFFPAPMLVVLPPTSGRSPHVHRRGNEIVFSAEASGWIVYGPYVDVEPDFYRCRFLVTETRVVGLHMDVVALRDGERVVLAQRVLEKVDDLSLEFEVTERLTKLEVRLRSAGGAHGVIGGLEIGVALEERTATETSPP